MFKEIKEKLIKEYNNLIDYHNDCSTKANILYKNTKKHKIELTAGLTLAAIIPVFIAFVKLLEGMTFSYISMTLTFASITGVSLGIGYLGQKLITIKPKRKMKKITNAKKNKKIVTELNKYEMEKLKTKNKIKVIEEIYEKVESKEKIQNEITLDGKYTVTENNLSEEELNKNYELILQSYNSKMKELDIIVSQNFLIKKFRDYRKNWDRIPNAISNGLVMALLLSFPTDMGFLGDELRKQIPMESMSDCIKQIFSAFIPMLAISPITIFSTIRSSNDNLYVFNELNNSLGENSLDQKPNKKIEENLEQNIDRLANELVELGYSLKETEHRLKEINWQKSDKEKTWDDVMYTEEEIHHYIQMSESPAPFNPETVFGKDETMEKKTGKKLVRTLNTNNTNNNQNSGL